MLAGAEISYSIAYEKDAKAVARAAERGVIYMANSPYMGQRFADVYNHMPNPAKAVKAFAGIAKVRRIGDAVRFTKDIGNALNSLGNAINVGNWKSAGDFFRSATSWIPKF
ncbi:MAG: hypothetical protein KC620_25210 [Myxococcales bacterium]|nr:hypothetical protein [Myxococcales bacterium]